MKLLTFTKDARQSSRIVLSAGGSFSITLEYIEASQGWTYALSYGDNFSINGMRLVCGFNILRQWRNILPFGLAVISEDGYEPVFQDDFYTGRVSVYVLDAAEIVSAEELIAS